MDTRQSDHKICLLRACLPSVLGVTLGKVCKRWRVLWSWHSANFTTFTECFGLALRQTLATLPSVSEMTLGKVYKLCRVFWAWHSVNLRNFTECFLSGTRQNRRHRAIPLLFLCREFLFAECLLTLGKLFAECAIKNTWQTTVCW